MARFPSFLLSFQPYKISLRFLFLIFFRQFLHLHCADLQRQTEQCDESVSIVVIIHISCSEACQ